MVQRQEAMRRKTAEHEAELRTKTELAKAAAETDGRIKQERQNHDLILEKVRLESKEKRDTLLQGNTVIPAYSDTLGTRGKCHCKRGVTVTTSFLGYERPFGTCQKCHCNRGVTVSKEICTSITTFFTHLFEVFQYSCEFTQCVV